MLPYRRAEFYFNLNTDVESTECAAADVQKEFSSEKF